MKHLRPFIILCGESGCGKTTAARELEVRGWNEVPTCTTREPRHPGERGHTFSTLDKFHIDYVHGNVVAETDFDSHKYWTTKEQIERYDVAIFDKQGVINFRQVYAGDRNVVVIYLKVSPLTRIQRMYGRGDSVPDILRRLLHDRQAFKGISETADFTIGCDGMHPKKVADCVLDIVNYFDVIGKEMRGELY